MKKALLSSILIASTIFFASAVTTATVNTNYGSATLSPDGIIGATVKGSLGGAPISVSFGSNAGNVCGGSNSLLNLLCLAQIIVTRLVPLAIGLGVLAFFWFLIEFIWKGKDNPDDQQKGLKGMGYSLIAIFAMVSIWGLIGLIGSLTGVNQGGNLPPIEMPRAK